MARDRGWTVHRWLGFLAALAGAGPASAQTGCALALAIGLDVSGSVTAADYRLQLHGTAAALVSDPVRDALLAHARTAPVRILVFEWSEPGSQALISDWHRITDNAQLIDLANRLYGHRRKVAPDATGIGSAMLYAAAQFDRTPDCVRQTLDLSGDGVRNAAPEQVRMLPDLAGVTINALAIGTQGEGGSRQLVDIDLLRAYFRQNVISGPNAFVEEAIGFGDIRAAMTRKLLREIPSALTGALDDTTHRRTQPTVR